MSEQPNNEDFHRERRIAEAFRRELEAQQARIKLHVGGENGYGELYLSGRVDLYGLARAAMREA